LVLFDFFWSYFYYSAFVFVFLLSQPAFWKKIDPSGKQQKEKKQPFVFERLEKQQPEKNSFSAGKICRIS